MPIVTAVGWAWRVGIRATAGQLQDENPDDREENHRRQKAEPATSGGGIRERPAFLAGTRHGCGSQSDTA